MPTNEVVTFPEAKRVELEQRPMPEIDATEVLVETERTLISTGSELALFDGSHQPDNLPNDGFPIEPGYSNVGTVIDVGADVSEELLGERVASPTVHARYVTAEEGAVVPVPSDISSKAATFNQIAAIAMNAVRRGEIAWGESAAVRGLGLVGQLAVRACLVSGATPVYGLDLDADRIEAVPDHGRVEPIHVGATEDEEPNEGVAEMVVDATGNPDTLGDGVSLIKEDGRFVVVGCPRQTVEFDFYRDCIVPSARIIGSYQIPAGGTGRWNRQAYAELFFEYLQAGDMDIESLVTAEPAGSNAPDVFKSLYEDPTGEIGVVFDWT
jgi:2-desacetyl-2-hydroxyethyl bacteriochlorophyllide A dehydrogenase